MSKRPDMRAYFAARIDHHVNGILARTAARRPNGVDTIVGDVDHSTIVVTMRDGTVWRWQGGRFATRKVNGCYAPLQPKPIR